MPRPNALETLARLGFAARGVMYAAIGYLVLSAGRTTDNGEAIGFVAGAGGRIVLAVLIAGLAGYGVWRLSEAAIDTEGNGTDAKGVAKRAGGAVSGVFHLLLAWGALSLLTGSGASGGDAAESGARTALALPGGWIALLAAALVLVVVGLYQGIKAIKLGFLKHLEPEAARRPWVAWVGRGGYLARGTVFLLTAWFTWQAGMHSRAAEAGSTEQALDTLPESIRIIVAAGFVLFGIFSLVEARYRRITDPNVLGRLQAAAR